MCATGKGRAIPLVGILTLACLVLASTGTLARVPGENAVCEAAASRTAVFSIADEVDADPSAAREGSRQRPTLPYHVDTEHFRIWYATTGPDMMYGWPDTTYLHECKVAAERLWRGLVDTLGFRPPPPDGSDPDGGGGSDHYDIYVMDCLPNWTLAVRGYATPGDPPGASTSYGQFHNDFTIGSPVPINFVRFCESWVVGIAAVYAHDADEMRWIRRATATWALETTYDYHNVFTFWLGYVLEYPYVSLSSTDLNHGNGMVLWNLYLSETHGAGIIPEIWYECEVIAGSSAFSSLDEVLGNYGTSLEDAVEEFWIWNWFTGERDDGNHYEEGGDPGWPEALPQAVYTDFPVVNGSPPPEERPQGRACNYIHFERGTSQAEALHIAYSGPGGGSPQAAHVAYLDNAGDAFYYGEILLNPFGNGDILVEGFDDMSVACLIVINKGSGVLTYSFDTDVWTGVPEESAFVLSGPAPNPFTHGTEIAYAVPLSGETTSLSIYDVSGRLVATLVDGVATPGAAVTYWDGTDTDGRRVASGVYFARLVAGDQTATRRVVLLR